MRKHWVLASLVMLGLGAPVRAEGQGPSSGVQFDSLPTQELVCTLPECKGLQSERRRSRLGRSVLVGALIGAGVGVLAGYYAHGICTMGEDSDDDCVGRGFLVFGFDVAFGAAIGLLVGASEPSRGPVPSE